MKNLPVLKHAEVTGPLIDLFFHVYRKLGYGFLERVSLATTSRGVNGIVGYFYLQAYKTHLRFHQGLHGLGCAVQRPILPTRSPSGWPLRPPKSQGQCVVRSNYPARWRRNTQPGWSGSFVGSSTTRISAFLPSMYEIHFTVRWIIKRIPRSAKGKRNLEPQKDTEITEKFLCVCGSLCALWLKGCR